MRRTIRDWRGIALLLLVCLAVALFARAYFQPHAQVGPATSVTTSETR